MRRGGARRGRWGEVGTRLGEVGRGGATWGEVGRARWGEVGQGGAGRGEAGRCVRKWGDAGRRGATWVRWGNAKRGKARHGGAWFSEATLVSSPCPANTYMLEGPIKAITQSARNRICIWVWNAESAAAYEHNLRIAWPSAIAHQAHPIIRSNSTVSRLSPSPSRVHLVAQCFLVLR